MIAPAASRSIGMLPSFRRTKNDRVTPGTASSVIGTVMLFDVSPGSNVSVLLVAA
jgi:hypothetical protein